MKKVRDCRVFRILIKPKNEITLLLFGGNGTLWRALEVGGKCGLTMGADAGLATDLPQ